MLHFKKYLELMKIIKSMLYGKQKLDSGKNNGRLE